LTQIQMAKGGTRFRVTCPCCAMEYNPAFLAEATSARRVKIYAWADPGESINPSEIVRMLRAAYAMLRDNQVSSAEQDLFMPGLLLQRIEAYGLPATPIWEAPMELRLRIRKIAADLQLPEFPTNPVLQTFRAEAWVSTQWTRILRERPMDWRAIRSQMLVLPARSFVGDNAPWQEYRDRGQHLHEVL
jgi:hypothetical protein